MSWADIPWELKERAQWCLAAPAGLYSEKGKEPLTVDHTGKLRFAKSNEPSTWVDWETASFWATHYGYHLGYMLNEDDPYTCIDLDVKDATNAPGKPDTWTTREQFDVFVSIINNFESYTERSASGKGFHIWVRGAVGKGFRYRGIECYSQERFMICTGNVTHMRSIEARPAVLESFVDYFRPKVIGESVALVEEDQIDDDFHILRTAIRASNVEKFLPLWRGEWDAVKVETPIFEYVEGAGRVQTGTHEKTAYPSQSEADLSLMSMLTFYSPSNEQCRRLFRMSGLGQREKATQNDVYLNRTLSIIRSREYAERAVNTSQAVTSVQTKLELAQQAIAEMQAPVIPQTVQTPMHLQTNVPQVQLPSSAAALATAAPTSALAHAAGTQGLAWPPGVMGKLAQFVYGSSYLAIKEVSIVAAIGVMAGLCGKGWNITQSGLNQYVTLIGQSGIGKEGMHSGVSHVIRACSAVSPAFSQFFAFDDFASGPALTKYCAGTPCFLNINGEWGHKLKRMARSEDGRDQAITTLRQVMTNLYQKSGPTSIVGGIKYSDKDKNATSVSGVAFSMIGETTPGTFYEALTEAMMEDGFLSRFINIEYKGLRPEANPVIVTVPDQALIEVLCNLCEHALKVSNHQGSPIAVLAMPDARALMNAFESECRDKINGSQMESYRQMWNRAALKALRLSALLAVADNHIHPAITVEQLEWSIDVVRRDIGIMQSRIEDGDVGATDQSRQRKLMSVLKKYMSDPLPKGRAGEQQFKDNSVVTRKYLQTYCSQSIAFNKFRGGATQALSLTIQSFIDQGYLAEMEKSKVSKDFSFNGKCYRVLTLDNNKHGDE